jgi:hypothetical protein
VLHTVAERAGPARHSRYVYGVRPKNFRLGPEDGRPGLPIKVGVIEPTGDEIEVISSLAGEPICAILHRPLRLRARSGHRGLPRSRQHPPVRCRTGKRIVD